MSSAAEVNSQSLLPSQPVASHGAPIGSPLQLGREGVVLHGGEMLEQAAEGQRGGADAGLQPGRVEVVGLPAEGRAQAVERTEEVLDLGAGERRFPGVVAVGHGATVDLIADVLCPEPCRSGTPAAECCSAGLWSLLEASAAK